MKKFPDKILCRSCQNETWHSILNETSTGSSNEDGEVWDKTTSHTLQCNGCENVCLLTEYVFSEDIDPRTGDLEITRKIYPSPYKPVRNTIEGVYVLPATVRAIYEETVKSINNNLMILAAIGIRSTIEAIALDKKITVNGIKGKISQMVSQGIVTEDGAKLLSLIRDIGNKATHEIKKHHREDIKLCIDIVEGMLKNLYVYPKEAEQTKELMSGNWIRVEKEIKE